MALLFEDKINDNQNAFVNKVINISEKLDINPNWLMAVMNSESGLNSKAVNKQSGDSSNASERAAMRATGLIQFMPSTAAGLGTTNKELYNMSNIKQLDYVYKYFAPLKSKIVSYIDLYMATFFPAAMGKPDSYVLQTSKIKPAIIAHQNPIFDLDKSGSITVGEVKKAFLKRIPENLRSSFEKDRDSVTKFTRRNWIPLTLGLTAVGAGLFFLFKFKKSIINNLNK